MEHETDAQPHETPHTRWQRRMAARPPAPVQTTWGMEVAPLEYRKIKRPFPPTASAHPMPLCSRWCPHLASARPPRAAPPGEHPARACPRRPAPPGAKDAIVLIDPSGVTVKQVAQRLGAGLAILHSGPNHYEDPRCQETNYP